MARRRQIPSVARQVSSLLSKWCVVEGVWLLPAKVLVLDFWGELLRFVFVFIYLLCDGTAAWYFVTLQCCRFFFFFRCALWKAVACGCFDYR